MADKIKTKLSDYTNKKVSELNLGELAMIIIRDWCGQAKDRKIYFGAEPYVMAMTRLHSVDNYYGLDSGKEIVLRFLCNATTWKGETAREIKAYLNKIVK